MSVTDDLLWSDLVALVCVWEKEWTGVLNMLSPSTSAPALLCLQALERLRAAGWDPAQPSVFVMEGLIGYLTAAGACASVCVCVCVCVCRLSGAGLGWACARCLLTSILLTSPHLPPIALGLV